MRTYEQIKDIFKEQGCELLETTYKNSSTKMRYLATCGHGHQITFDNFRAGKGRLCKECKNKKKGERLKYSYEFVKNKFAEEGCELLSETYESATKQKLTYIAQCGHENKIAFAKFIGGAGRKCRACVGNIKYDFAYVASEFEKNGCELLETEYINCKTPLRYRALCGHEAYITFDAFLNARRLLECETCSKRNYENVKNVFKENGCTLLSKEYHNGKEKLRYIASCGHENEISFDKFNSGQGRKCKECSHPRGEEHFKYNPLLTEEDRMERDMQSGKARILRKETYKRDGYRCVVCGADRDFNAHHLDSWDANEEKRFDLDNMVTLCVPCHKAFHKRYGYGNNTRMQFQEFLNNYHANTEGLTINQVCNE